MELKLQDLSVMHLPFHQLCSSEVGSHGLVMLALHCKRMAIGDPRRTVRPLQSGGFATGDIHDMYNRTYIKTSCNVPSNRMCFLLSVQIHT